MQTFQVDFEKEYGLQGGSLSCMVVDPPFDAPTPDWKRPCVIVVPGGAYAMVSKREGEPVAAAFMAQGYQACILTYSVVWDNVGYPTQLIQLGCAVDYIKKHAEQMHVNPDEIFCVGFSAGGHLVGNLAVDWQSIPALADRDLDTKPTAVCLAYPVIARHLGHAGSHDNLLRYVEAGEKETLVEKLDLTRQVSSLTPPTFLWSTVGDTCVPPQNTLAFALALANHKVPFEVHVYPQGEHGSSICTYEFCSLSDTFQKKNRVWLTDCADFFRMYCKEPY